MPQVYTCHMFCVVVVDEIGSSEEVRAVKSIAQRGVMLVGTAHGVSLSSLISNPELNTLVGGVHQVVIGDKLARFVLTPSLRWLHQLNYKHHAFLQCINSVILLLSLDVHSCLDLAASVAGCHNMTMMMFVSVVPVLAHC